MSRFASSSPRPFFLSLALAALSAAWWGCGATGESPSTTSTTTSSSSSTGGGGDGGSQVALDGGADDGGEDAGPCTSTSAVAHRVPLDLVFVIDRSESMGEGKKWPSTITAITTFVNDPGSIGVGAGMVFFPSLHGAACPASMYTTLDVPVDVLPKNAFPMTNAVPEKPTGWGTPIYAALSGALMVASAHQDAHPDHKVAVVLATDGDPWECGGGTIDEIATAARSARDYNGVLTYVVGVSGSIVANLDKIAKAGGTGASYDITQDSTQFAAALAAIRGAALGCDFEIPPAPDGLAIDWTKVNFSYKQNGQGAGKILPRADDLADCGGLPGWYFNSNTAPTKIFLCPTSCATVQADVNAVVDVLFGCKSIPN